MKRPTVAICYDFDGTLAPLYMQEYGFFLSLPEERRISFWKESHELARKESADPILCYMKKMIDDARWYGGAANLTREDAAGGDCPTGSRFFVRSGFAGGSMIGAAFSLAA